MVAKAFRSTRHPIAAHIVPIRRCNLSCVYCNEYDAYSKPVPTAEMIRRIDRLAALGTSVITLSGGEPLLHPELEEIIRCIRHQGILAGMLTNGYLITPERIRRLNRAGLDQLQISIDNVNPDEISKKSLKVLDRKLQWLAKYAEFDVNINSVVGGTLRNPKEALIIASRARALGFTSTVGLIHNHQGQSISLNDEQHRIYREILSLKKPFYSFARVDQFQRNISSGLPNQWHCRAGSRYLYICEDGMVHWCSQQRGYPGIPLENYTAEHLEREFHSQKPCAPYCTVSCVHQVALLDSLREQPLEALRSFLPAERSHWEALPRLARLLAWMFVTSGKKKLFTAAAVRILRVR